MANPYDQVPLGQQTNQLGAPDNSIQYSDMTKFQMISQYQSSNYINENPRSSHNYTMMLSNPRFNYGTNGMDTRFYERQQQNQRNMLGTSLATAATSWAPMLIPGAFTAPGLAIGAAAAVPFYFVQKGIDRTIQRQRAMQQMSSDIEQYREQLGMPGMSMGQASNIGYNLTRSMFRPNQFFDPQKQQEILKYGLSNDMLSAKGRGMVTGDVKTFEKNFKELMDTVAKVSKTMKVTAEGAMSVIKEMQMSGYGTMGQISSSVTAAKAYGGMTGLGVQNMLQIGAAGAQAAQGTPYSSAAGASMYMGGAAMAGYMARGNDPRAAKSVEMAGGVAQAGGVIGQTMMNIMQSGMGARVLASVMTKEGKLDYEALANLNKGTQSGHEIVTRASLRAHSWGTGGNVMFARNRSAVADEIAQNEIAAAQVASANFNAWRSNRRGTREQQAQAYAQTFVSGGQREQNVFADWLLSDKGLSEMVSSRMVAGVVENQQGGYPSTWKKMGRAIGDSFSPIANVGESTVYGFQDVISSAFSGDNIYSRVKRGIGSGLENALRGTKFGRYGLFDRANIGDMGNAYNNLLGLNSVNLTQGDLEAYRATSMKDRKAAGLIDTVTGTSGWTPGLLEGASLKQVNRFYQTSNTLLGNGTIDQALLNKTNLQDLGIAKGSADEAMLLKASPVERAQIVFNRMKSQANYDSQRRSKALVDINAIDTVGKGLVGSDLKSFEDAKLKTMFKTDTELSAYSKSSFITPMERKVAQAAMAARGATDILARGDVGFTPDSFSAYAAVVQENNAKALKRLGLAPGQGGMGIVASAALFAGIGLSTAAGAGAGIASSTLLTPVGGTAVGVGVAAAGIAASTGFALNYDKNRKFSGLSRLAGVNAKEFARDPAYAEALIAERVMSGGLNIRDEKKFIEENGKEAFDDIMRARNQLRKSYKLVGKSWDEQATDYMTRFGRDVQMSSEQMSMAKKQQYIVGKNNSFFQLLKYNKVEGQALADVQSYLNPLSANGLFSQGGGVMSASVAQTIASGISGATANDVQKMKNTGELLEKIYTGSKAVSKTSQLKIIQNEIDRVLDLKEGSKTIIAEEALGKKARSMSKDDALKALVDKKKLYQEAQATSDTSEGPKGKSLSAAVTPPILNYWNSKWSM